MKKRGTKLNKSGARKNFAEGLKNAELKEINSYIFSTMGIVFALFIPVSTLILSLTRGGWLSSLLLSISLPLTALVLGILGIIKGRKYKTRIARVSRVLSIVAILVSSLLIGLNMYIFINSI